MKSLKFYHLSGAGSLVIAFCSAIFSVYGLSTLFAGSRLAVIIMTSALELGKILSVSMLYNYAKKLPKLIQRYLIAAIVALMFITSLGAYGFLASAYQKSSDKVSASSTSQNYNTEQQNLILERINNKRQQISKDTTRLDTLNNQRAAQEARLNQAQASLNRRMQDQARADISKSDTEIQALNKRIDTSYTDIEGENNKLNTLKQDSFKIREEDRKIDVGPLRYLSRIFSSSMDSIVTVLILILVFVFDPLAIVLWMSTNAIVKAEREQIKRAPKTHQKKMVATPTPAPRSFGEMIKEEFDKFKKQKK